MLFIHFECGVFSWILHLYPNWWEENIYVLVTHMDCGIKISTAQIVLAEREIADVCVKFW